MAILISSHNLSELENFCTKIAIIQNGEMIESSTMEEAKKVEGKTLYDIEVDLVEKSKEVLKDRIDSIDEKTIKIHASKEEIPELIETLVMAKIKVYKVCEDQTSLEDAFLKKTGGNVIE